PCSPTTAAGSRWRQTPHERSSAGRAAATASAFQPGSSLQSLSASTRRGGGGVGVGVGEGAAVGAGAGVGAACSPLRGGCGRGETQPASSNVVTKAAGRR